MISKQFGRIQWGKKLQILKEIGIEYRDSRLTAAFYMGQTAVVRTIFGETESITICRGTRHRFLLSPIVFNIYDEIMMREAFKNVEEVIVGSHLINDIRFADDKVILARTKKGLQKLMTNLDSVADGF